MPEEANTPPQEVVLSPWDAPTPLAAVDASSESGSDANAPEGNVPPVKPGDEDYFHKEGEQVWKTKEEYISWSNKQRGNASKVVGENRKLTEALATKESEMEALRQVKASQKPGAAAAASTDPEVQAAIVRLKQEGKFVTSDDIASFVTELTELKQERAQLAVAQASVVVDGFIEANPRAADAKAELADIMDRHNLPQNAKGLRDAYILHFGEVPKDAEKTRQDAEAKSRVTGLKKAQAGGSSAGGNAGTNRIASDAMPFNWGKLRE